ncbi:MAG: pyruvate dehydrogenase (acetyl-transferring) E1 component subunit alpha, partial [Saprospiraceae bacterium]
PLLTTEDYLLKNNIFSSEDLATLQEQVTEEMDEAVRFAEESPLPDPEGLYEDNYSEPYPYLV